MRSNTTYTAYETQERSFLNKIRVGANVSYARGKSTSIDANSEYGSVLGSALAFNPTVPVYADDATAAQILKDHPYAVKDKDGRVYSIPPSDFCGDFNPWPC